MNLTRINDDTLARIESFYGLVPASPEFARQQVITGLEYHRDVERLRQENRRLKRVIAILCIGGTITWVLGVASLLH